MSIILGLTGSIGMGKSTTAGFFREAGVPIWDADATVHKLYEPEGAAALEIATLFPSAINADGSVNRDTLRSLIAADRAVLDQLNAVVHPLVAKDRHQFIAENAEKPLIVLDVPLLFETGGDALCDVTLVVSAPPDVQRARVLARGMSETDFEMILARQVPDADKRARATYVIETLGVDQTRADVLELIQTLTDPKNHA